jgi:antitoxin (DNA-binding transcriptional repressor) of toxin-antitoxin stability system
MQTIGMFEAKTHLPEVIRNIQKGETYMLKNRNQEVAIIMPVSEYYRSSKEFSYEKIRSIFKTNTLGSSDEIISMRDEGRK